jgi:hypothetical protein
LPTSSVTSAPSASLAARSSSPKRRTSSPRRGAGMSRQALNAACDRAMTAGMSAGLGFMDAGDFRPVDGRADGKRAAGQFSLGQPACGLQDIVMGHGISLR